jgi:hypothetical protein
MQARRTAMSEASLEERVAELERQMSSLLRGNANDHALREPRRDDWMSTVGMFDGDAIMKEVIEDTRKVREDDRKRTEP